MSGRERTFVRRSGGVGRYRTVVVATALAALARLGAAAGPVAAATLPVYEEPLHRLVYANRWVRILDVRVPPGVTTQYHVHSAPIVGVGVESARTRAQRPGEPPGALEERQAVPYLFDNWRATLPYEHRVANEDTVPFHYVVGEWLASPGIEPEIRPADAGLELVQEGTTVRVFRLTLPPHATAKAHTHTAPGLTVLGTPGDLLEEGDRPESSGGEGAGRWSWHVAGSQHVLRNPGDRPLTVFEIDWR